MYVSKDTLKEVKKQPVEWEKTFANPISYKGLIPRIHKEFPHSTTKMNSLIKQGQKT